jgi:selenocysteine lyase/cysteine desulfurase
MDLASARALFEPDHVYLDTASYGLPPRMVLDALAEALEGWRHGSASWSTWQDTAVAARASFARLGGVRPEDVAGGASLSALAGLVAASLADGARVVAPEVEFTSNLFPWLVQAGRGVEVRTVPLERLADAIDAGTTLVAVSAVQSADGRVADLAALREACDHHGAQLFVDATQAFGWLPIDANVLDYCATDTYKWLLSPKGTAFMSVRPDRLEALRPHAAGWYAGEDVWDSAYGPPLRLAASARRLDVSPAWFPMVGTRPALELIEGVGIEAIHRHDLALANRFLAGLGEPAGDSAIVSVSLPDPDAAAERLGRAGVRMAVRGGFLRASFHLYNTETDVDAALNALAD